MNNRENRGDWLKILKNIWWVLEKVIFIILAFVSIVIVTQRVSENEKAFLGFRIFKVETGSMEPKYKVGDVILVKTKSANKIKVGDDVTYTGTTGVMKGKLVTHQVIDIEQVGEEIKFHTKGIANTAEDPVITSNQVNGVVQTKMYLLTAICSVLNNPYIFYFIGIIPLTVLIFFTVIKGNIKKYENYKGD